MTITVITDINGTNDTKARGVFETWAAAVEYLRRLSAAEAESAVVEVVS